MAGVGADEGRVDHLLDRVKAGTQSAAKKDVDMGAAVQGQAEARSKARVESLDPNEARYRNLCLAHEGLLYEDEVVQIHYVDMYHSTASRQHGTIEIVPSGVEARLLHAALVLELEPSDAEELDVVPLPGNTFCLAPDEVRKTANVELRGLFRGPLRCQVVCTFEDTEHVVPLALPVVITKFLTPYGITAAEFERVRGDLCCVPTTIYLASAAEMVKPLGLGGVFRVWAEEDSVRGAASLGGMAWQSGEGIVLLEGSVGGCLSVLATGRLGKLVADVLCEFHL